MRFGDWYLSKQPRQDLTSLPLQTGCGSPRLPPDTILTHASESTAGWQTAARPLLEVSIFVYPRVIA
jgi:hypothetical protein